MAALLVAVIPAGLYARHMASWPRLANGLGAVLYEVAGMAFVLLVWPRARVLAVAVAVFVGTSTIELAQLSDAGWLVDIRATTPGRLLLGGNGGFDRADFLLYGLGCGLGYGACRLVQRYSDRLTRPRAASRALPPERDAPGS